MSDLIHKIEELIDFIGVWFELIGVVVIVIGFIFATVVLLRGLLEGKDDSVASYKVRLGKTLLLALEILVAADIIRSAAVGQSVERLFPLALLVLIRTFLSWTLELEIHGRWPWQKRHHDST